MARITLADKAQGYPNLATDFNALKAGINDLYPVVEGHSTTLTFDKNSYMDTAIAQSGPLSYDLAASGHVDGVVKRLRIQSDGVSAITFPIAWIVYGLTTDGTNSGVLPVGTYSLWMVYLGGNVEVSIPAGVTTATPASNAAPTANAGTDQTITAGDTLTLSGSGTDTDGTIASYAWTKVTGGAATITDPSSATTTVTGLTAGTYTFRLTVTDDAGGTGTDTVSVTVNAGAATVTLNTPGGFTTTGTNSSVLLSWTDTNSTPQESGILVQHSDDAATWADLVTLAANTTTYEHTGLVQGTSKYHRLRALGDGVNTTDSPWTTTIKTVVYKNSDTFDSATLDTQFWTLTEGTGTRIVQENGYLHLYDLAAGGGSSNVRSKFTADEGVWAFDIDMDTAQGRVLYIGITSLVVGDKAYFQTGMSKGAGLRCALKDDNVTVYDALASPGFTFAAGERHWVRIKYFSGLLTHQVWNGTGWVTVANGAMTGNGLAFWLETFDQGIASDATGVKVHEVHYNATDYTTLRP